MTWRHRVTVKRDGFGWPRLVIAYAVDEEGDVPAGYVAHPNTVLLNGDLILELWVEDQPPTAADVAEAVLRCGNSTAPGLLRELARRWDEAGRP